MAARLDALKLAQRNQKQAGPRGGPRLAEDVAEHLVAKAKTGLYTERWLASSQLFLDRAIAYFGANRELAAIDVADVRRWTEHLSQQPRRKPKPQTAGKSDTRKPEAGKPAEKVAPLTGGTIRHHLNTLSNLFRHAINDGRLASGHNPARDLMEKPKARRVEAKWLEVPDAALYLESVRSYKPKRPDLAVPFLYPLVATYLLTGGRRAEVLGLEVSDINFERETVTFRPSQWRRLKTEHAARVVPLWPQLAEILTAYLSARTAEEVLHNRPTHTFLFPVVGPQGEGLLTNFDDSLDGAAERGGWKRGEIRTKMFRHTYCSARLQMLDQGAPIGTDTVRREMGHKSPRLVERIYGHLGAVRHRAEVVEYRVEQHTERLADRLSGLAVLP